MPAGSRRYSARGHELPPIGARRVLLEIRKRHQLIANRGLSGKRLRLSGWIKCDSLMAQAFLKLYCTTLEKDVSAPGSRHVGGTTPWERLETELVVPEGTYKVWAWMMYDAPADGRVYFDDASLEILGPARTGAAPDGAQRPAKAAPGRKAKPGGGGTR